MRQKTVKKVIRLTGQGLHSGQSCEVEIKPAPENFGIRFRRSDVDKASWIRADARKVSNTERSTTLQGAHSRIGTVEHIMAALYAHGVHNAEIHVNGPEVPIMDGSAAPFSNAILEAGTEEQKEDAYIFALRSPISFKDESGAEYMAIPADDLEIDCIIDYKSSKEGRCHAHYSPDTSFHEEISSARTFVFASELEGLAREGLIRGGDLDNAVVLSPDSVSDQKLRDILTSLGKNNPEKFIEEIRKSPDLSGSNEPARHKLLDLIGDLALVGCPVRAQIVAKKPGHKGNVAFAKILYDAASKDQRLRGKPIYDPESAPVYDTVGILELLPHRYPFLMVDKIIELSDTHVVGVKNISINESLFQGHFPNNPVFPGVLQMEALAQTGGILALNSVDNPSDWDTYFLKMDNVKFKKKVLPGDSLILKMELLTPIRRGIVHMQGTAYVGDQIVSEGELTAQIFDRTTLK